MTIVRFLAAAWCVLGPFSLSSYAANINGEATYVSFSVPGAIQGTFPMSINASMTVTGYYNPSSTETRGFLRDPDGTFTTVDIPGSTSCRRGYRKVSSGTPAAASSRSICPGAYKILSRRRKYSPCPPSP
jgi:hypothetical protein